MLKTPSATRSFFGRGSQALLQDLARGIGVLVREDLRWRRGSDGAVDDARAVQLVGDDDVLFRGASLCSE